MRSGYETSTIGQFFQSDSILKSLVFQMSCGGWFNQTSTWTEILKFAINQIFPKKILFVPYSITFQKIKFQFDFFLLEKVMCNCTD